MLKDIINAEIIHTTMDMGIAAMHLFFNFAVLYFIVPIIPRINPTIGIKKENTRAQSAKVLFSPFSITGAFEAAGAAEKLLLLFSVGQPHLGQTTALSLISFPQFWQNIFILLYKTVLSVSVKNYNKL